MGLTVLDAGVVIAVLDATDVHHAAAARVLTNARDQGDELVIPVSAYAECLVSPSRSGPAAIATVDRFIDALPARVEPATRAVGTRRIAPARAVDRASARRAVPRPSARVAFTSMRGT